MHPETARQLTKGDRVYEDGGNGVICKGEVVSNTNHLVTVLWMNVLPQEYRYCGMRRIHLATAESDQQYEAYKRQFLHEEES